jgi:hypothetical protein
VFAHTWRIVPLRTRSEPEPSCAQDKQPNGTVGESSPGSVIGSSSASVSAHSRPPSSVMPVSYWKPWSKSSSAISYATSFWMTSYDAFVTLRISVEPLLTSAFHDGASSATWLPTTWIGRSITRKS